MSRSPIDARAVPPRPPRTPWPEPIAAKLGSREKRPLGDHFGLTAFGVNLTTLAPGAQSALRHYHTQQDELVYVVQGTPTLITDAGEQTLAPGMCVGFRGGSGDAHCLVNRSDADVVFLEVGDRRPGDGGVYPDDDIVVLRRSDGGRAFEHKDGRPY